MRRRASEELLAAQYRLVAFYAVAAAHPVGNPTVSDVILSVIERLRLAPTGPSRYLYGHHVESVLAPMEVPSTAGPIALALDLLALHLIIQHGAAAP